MTEKKGIHGMK